MNRAKTRDVIEEAVATNDALGNDNLGSLSYSHGFLPRTEPRRMLSPSHTAWDQVAGAIPEMFRTYSTRRMVEQMPILSAAEDALPDIDLLRASSIFSILAHVYWYADPKPPENGIPAAIQQPWEQISQRLHRPAPHLSFIDLNTHNWHLIDDRLEQPFIVENLRLAIPMIGNEDERRFQMTPIEMLYLFSPALDAIVKAQEAVINDEPNTLKEQLVLISDLIKTLSYVSLMKVNPNPYSEKYYVNPVVWGKTAALFASPFQKEYVPGPSGTAIPSFTTLDIFFGRKSYKTSVGHETHETRRWFPRFWQEWLHAVESISIPDYVNTRGDSALKGIFAEAKDAYAGESGLLNRHRIKAYGYLDLSFKAGRVKTLGGFAGSFSERVWDRMAVVLDETRLERYGGAPQTCHMIPVKRVERLRDHAGQSVSQIVFDISGTGIRYSAGDRCGVLPENSDELVEKTLRALKATGDEPITLDARWREHVTQRYGYQDSHVLSLATLLKFGRIRPVERDVALNLYALTYNERLRKIIDGWAEDQWELWDLIETLSEANFNPRRLWKAVAGDREHICRIVPPERWRLYSISSDDASIGELHLTAAALEYQTGETQLSRTEARTGTASGYLARLCAEDRNHQRPVSIKIVHPPRFSLPQDPARPIVMFAGGTGISPMKSLIEARAKIEGAGLMWLFFATRTEADFYYKQDFAPLVAAGKLRVCVAMSRQDGEVIFDPKAGQFACEVGQRQRIGDVMLREDSATDLWEMLRSTEDGGQGAYFYVCGRTTLANSVLDALKSIIANYTDAAEAQAVLYRLIGEDRLMMEIFTTYGGAHFDERKAQISISELVTRNNDDNGYWMAISGRVYDVSEFGHIHPGGLKIIQSYSGMDATYAYQVIQHHVNPEVDAMLGMYELGVLKMPDFGQAWGVALSDKGIRFISMRDAYQAWTDLLFMIVEMENGILNDFRVRREPFTDLEMDGTALLTPIKMQRLGQTHGRLVDDYLPLVFGTPLNTLWAMTLGVLGNQELDVRWMQHALEDVQQSEYAHMAITLSAKIDKSLEMFDGTQEEFGNQYCAFCDALEREDMRVLAELKEAVRQGAAVFEMYERDAASLGQYPLLGVLQGIPTIIAGFYARLNAAAERLPQPVV